MYGVMFVNDIHEPESDAECIYYSFVLVNDIHDHLYYCTIIY